MAIKTDGSLWTWGCNLQGQIGDGTITTRRDPVRVGTDNDWGSVSASNHTIGIKTDGSLWAWGNNEYGQLGINSIAVQRVPIQVGVDNDWALSSTAGVPFKKDFIITVVNTYTVTFMDWDGVVLDEQIIKHGDAAIGPNPFREGYSFLGWDVEFDCVTSDLIVTALYKANLDSVTPLAYVEKLNGNKNNLYVTVTETYTDGSTIDITKMFVINNNAADKYKVGTYEVFVDTKGNVQIRACYIVE
jgi:hypothetical protein